MKLYQDYFKSQNLKIVCKKKLWNLRTFVKCFLMQCQLFSHERIFLLQNNFPLYIECVQCGMKVFFTPYKTVNKISERILSSKIVLKTFLYTLNAFNVKWKFSLLHKTVNKISERMRSSKFFSFIHWKCSMWIESFLCFIRQ